MFSKPVFVIGLLILPTLIWMHYQSRCWWKLFKSSIKQHTFYFFFIVGSFGRRPLLVFANPLYPFVLYFWTHWYSIPRLIPALSTVSELEASAKTFATNSYFSSGVQFLLAVLWLLRYFLCSQEDKPVLHRTHPS